MASAWAPQQATRIAGAAYMLTYAPAYSWFFVYPRVFVAGDVARMAMFFLCLGSTIYCYLLVRSRYIPRVLALSGVAASALFVVGILTRFLFPALVTAAFAAVRALPLVALVPLALILVPIFSFEFTIGSWLLVKGVHIPEHT